MLNGPIRRLHFFLILWSQLLLCDPLLRVVQAGEFNEVLKIGDDAPIWSDLPGTDGKKHSLPDYKNKDVVVVFFTCSSCEAAVEYEDRINDIVKRLSSKVAFVGICANLVKKDTLPELTEYSKKRGFEFDYVHDETQRIAKAYGAVFTPEFFVFDRDRKLVYMGAFDDKSDPSLVKQHFLEDAILAALKGEKPVTKETIARGCRIRFAREKR